MCLHSSRDADGGANVWTCRMETVAQKGAQGITMGVTTQTDDEINYVMAFKADHYVNSGDAGDVTAGSYI